MATTRPITDLDFDQIKTDMINFIKTNPSYTDYNFEGSALNALIDILAYNTHNNAYYANMVHNEGFLDTAQKRASVVSRAKELGYTPRSTVCSTAFVDIVANGVPQGTPTFILPRGTSFGAGNDNGFYPFLVANDHLSKITDGVYHFDQVKLVSGVQASNLFKVDTITNVRSIFTIPNKNVDISTLTVFVRDSLSSVERVEYFLAENVYELTSDSRKFFVQEAYDGYFQFYFGGDVFGKQPVNGNVIDIDYFVSTSLDLPDLCTTFKHSGTVGLSTSLSATTTQMSYGGADKETIDSIKYNAKKSNSAKERAVTANDYELSLKEKFNFIKSVSVWGGENHVPPVYGKVFLSVQPVTGYVISESVKRDVLVPALLTSSMMTITPVIVDPSYIAIDFTTKIKYNPYKTTLTIGAIESGIKTTIANYITSISSFNTDYFESYLTNKIVAVDPSIISVDVNKMVGFKMTPTIGIELSHTKLVNNKIYPLTVTSSKFNVFYETLETVIIKVLPDKFTTKINVSGISENIYSLGLFNSSGILIKEIGTVNENTGQFDLVFGIHSYVTNSRFINIRMMLVSNDILVDRNQILMLESDTADYTANMPDNNKVVVEIYGK